MAATVCVLVVCDNGVPNLCDTTKIKINVTPVNDPPVANNDVYSTNEDVTLNVPAVTGVLANDSDPIDGTAVTVTGLVGTPTGGTVTLNANGSFTFVPTPNFTGAASFCYRIEDSGTPTPALADTACVTINVVPVNDTPEVPDTTITQCEDCGPITVCLPITDVETTQDYFVAALSCGPNSGTVSTSINQITNILCVTYSANANFNGSDSVCVVVCDNGVPNLCDTTKIKINVTPVNDPPVANNDVYSTNEDVTLNVPAVTGVLANDSDPIDGTAVTVTGLVGTPTGGTVTLNANGSFTFVPTPNFTGAASFCYRIEDSGTPTPALADTACVTINVVPVNDTPEVPDTTITQCEDCGPITVCLPITDVETTQDYFVAALSCGPNSGTVSTSINQITNILCVTYSANANFNGSDSVCVVVCDNGVPNLCDTTKIKINVTPVNDPPVANNDVYSTNEDVTLNVPAVTGVLANDSDPIDGTAVTVTGLVGTPTGGTVTLNANGSFTFVPTPNFTGAASFCYRIEDSGTPTPALADTACVTINVVPVNDTPEVPDTTITQCEDCGPITVCLPITDVETTQDYFVAALSCGPNSGTVSTSINQITNILCVTYSANANFNGSDSVCVVVCDNGVPNLCDTTKIKINVTPVNDPPVANNDVYSTNEDVTLNVPAVTGVLANDSDPIDGTAVTVTGLVGTPTGGTVTLNANGSFTFVPTPNFTGAASFCYRIEDSGTPTPALADTACVTINVVPINDTPEVPDTTITQCEDCGPITVCLPITDNDLGQTLNVAAILCGPNSGSSTPSIIGTTLCVTYTPNPNFNGNDSICIVVCDNGSPVLCDTTKIKITVTPVNDPPVANNDTYNTNENQTLNVTTPGVLSNDSDPIDGTAVTVTGLVGTPTGGTVTLNANGSFTFVPTPNFNGVATFCYRIEDSGTPTPALADTACVTINVAQVNYPPVIPDTTVTTCEDCPITVCVPYTDQDLTDAHTVTLACLPTLGTVSGINLNQVTDILCFNYTPSTNVNGVESICFVVCDNGVPQLCDTSNITINVTPVNDPPYADTINVVLFENTSIGVNVSAATGDLEGNPLTYTYGAVSPANGTYTITGTGAIVVTPNPNFVGIFTIPYTVCDLSPFPVNVLCDNAAIIVTVLPTSDTLVNHAPIANNDYVTTPQNTGIVVNQLANDYDVDGDVLQVTINNTPNNGSFTVNANGTINYTPNSGFFGFDTIGYTICDPTALNNPKPLCDNAIIVIYVSTDTTSTTNDAPVAVDDFATICSNESVTLRLLLNDSDPNGDALSVVTIIDNVNNGTLTAGSLGVYLYAPNTGFNGNDTLIYRICDNGSPVLCDTAIAVVKVNGSPVITPSIASLNNCSGDSVNITFTSSVPGTTFTWTASNGTSGAGNIQTVLVNNGTFTQNILYTVTGVAPGGCASTTLNIPVTVKPRPIATASQNATIVCSGESVVINANASIPGTTFTWSATNGASGSGAIITNNPINSGTSNITVTYSIVPLTNGCTGDTLKIDITVKPTPTITVTPTTQTICSGAPITITASSSVPGTTFTWNGTNGNSGTGSVINDSPVNNQVGNIVVTYTINAQFNGCNATTVTSLVTVRPNPIASAGLDKTLQNCPSAIVSIGTVPAAAGGTAPYSFSWSPATGLSSTTIGNPNVQGLTNNTLYTLLVTDANNCSATDQVLVTVAPSTLVAEAGNGGELCSNALNGIQIGGIPSAVAGNAPFVYSWIPSAGLNNPASSNPIAKPDTTTKYQLTVTDAFGCVATDTVVVIINNAPIAFAGLDTFLCQGNCVQLGGQPTVVGGTGAITYNWSPTLALSSGAVANPLACPAQTSTYFVTATDSKGCIGTSFVVLVVYENPIADAGPDKTISECFADTIQIGSSPTATGGQAPYTYTWSPAISLSSDTISNPLVSGLLTDQLYTLVVTDDLKCSATDQALVTVVPTSLQVDAGNVGFLCAGGIDSVTLGGLPTVTGGLGPYTYTWSPVVGLSDVNASNPKARPTSTTTYYVTVVDALGCSQVDSTTITINPGITVNAGTTQTVCAGTTVNIGGSPSASGGSGVYTYLWSPSASVANTTAANTTATPLTTETYTLLVTDDQGCSATASVLINVNANPIAQAGADKTLVRCPGDSVIIGDLPAAIGGTGPYTYSWSPAGGLSSTTVANPIVKGLNLDITYTLTVTDANGCSSTDAVTVIVQQNTLFANAGPNRAICSGVASCTTLGTATTAIGGTLPYTYVWTGGGLNDSTISNPIACNIPTTTYNLVVTDSKGCTSSSSVVVTVNPTPVANAGVDTAICAGSSVQIGGNPTATVGNAPFTYQWSPTTGLSAANASNPLATPTITTTYNVTVTSSNGCTATDGILVTIRSRPVVNAGADKSLVACAGDTVTLGAIPVVTGGGTAPYTYLWSPNTNLSSTTAQNPFVTG
jgi:hypothetical protein